MAKDISFKKLASYWPLYFFVAPSFLLVATFSYFPAGSAIYHSFFRWDGNTTNNFIGLTNYNKALGQPLYWVLTLVLTMMMIKSSQRTTPYAQSLKMICGLILPFGNILLLLKLNGFPALSAESLLVPLVFWGVLFVLLYWRVNRDSESRSALLFAIGTLGAAKILSGLGLPGNLAWSLAVFVTGVILWTRKPGSLYFLQGMRISQALAGVGMVLWSLAMNAGGDKNLWAGFAVIAILVLANLIKMIPSISTAVVVHRLKSDAANYWYRVLFVVPMIIPGMVYLLLWKFFFESDGLFNLVLRKTGIMHLLYLFDYWTSNGVFIAKELAAELSISDVLLRASEATPTWLGTPELVLPAFIMWGFPWVGVVGVLLYLAGLQSIDQSVYEAADLDGVGAFGKFMNIELPLILTQVRINLVLMIIQTLKMYGMILVLFGDGGGPNGKMMVPGLLMFRSAFVESYAGYACCIGLILFFTILILTELNNRFIRVEK